MGDILKNIAIIGASGSLGKPTLDALIKLGKHNITIISRKASTATFPEGPNVVVRKGDYDDDNFMQSCLETQDVLVLMLALHAMDEQDKLVKAAAKAGVEYIMPSAYGNDISSPSLREMVPILQQVYENTTNIQKLGLKFLAVTTGPWLDYALARDLLGFNVAERKATIYSDSAYFVTSTLTQVGNAIARLLGLPLSTIEARFANNWVRVGSFRVTHPELFSAVLTATNTKESEWVLERRSANDLLEEGYAKLQAGNPAGVNELLLGANFIGGLGGDYSDKLDNELLGLSEESLGGVVEQAVKR